ncbi:MAG: 4Fe-4S dicluster domain-containing protein [Gammaproteobacteria bacterium]|nr:4Fe-4S dicluster domain-containing protein [Gammaproteobacteria bacterium]
MAATGFLLRGHMQNLLDALRAAGYRCVGPQVRDGAIIYDTLSQADDLPWGWRDEQKPGRYRLGRHDSPWGFAWANGPQGLKPLLFASADTLQTARRTDEGALHFESATPHAIATAVLGVRACDLAALRLQDQHFLEGLVPDPHYAARRADLFLIAVHCTHPAATCFCVSTGDGPRAEHGFDLALGETEEGFLGTAGSAAGAGFAKRLPLRAAEPREQDALEARITAAAAAQQRSLPARDLRAALFANLRHPRWEEVATRCLSCGNCTAVCPSCFCHAQSEEPTLDGLSSMSVRRWDSCFTQGHSAIHGIVIRADTRQRYRQWLTHKLGSWHDQYGRSGCVGCGRCITWCPVGIDITEEAAGICGSGHV